MSTNFKLNKEEAAYVNELLKIVLENTNRELSVKENMIVFWLKRFPEASRVDAEKSVDKIIKGVSAFTQNYEEAENADESWIITKIDEATKDLTSEQKYECMLSLLLALRSVDADLLSEKVTAEGFNAQRKFDELKNSTISVAGGAVSDQQLEELSEHIKEAVKNSGISIVGNTEIVDLIRELPENKNAASSFVESNWSDADFKNYASLATCIAYLEGATPSIPANTDPEIIAIGVTAGIEKDKIIKQATLGQITWEIACKALKVIGGVALVCLLAWLCYQLLITAILTGGVLVSGFLGGTMVGFVIGMILGGFVGYRSSEYLVVMGGSAIVLLGEGYDKVTEFIADGYVKVTDYIKDTIIPTFYEYQKKLWEFIDERILQGLLKIKVTKIEQDTAVKVNI